MCLPSGAPGKQLRFVAATATPQKVHQSRICHVSIRQFERAFGGITVLTQAWPVYSEDILLT